MRHSEVNNVLMKKENTMKRSFKTRILMPTIFLLLGALPVAAIERPFALSGTGVGVFVTDAEGHVIGANVTGSRSEEHTSELQSLTNLVCRLLLEKKKTHRTNSST